LLEERNTPKTLLAAAAPLFATSGFNVVTIHQIAEAAKVNVALISYYFGGKEGLYAAVLESQLCPLLQSLETWRTNTSSLPVIEQLYLYVDTIFTQQRQQPFLSQLLLNELIYPTACGQPLIQKYFDQSFQCIHCIIEAGARSGEFKPGLPVEYVKFIWYSVLNFHIANNIVNDLQVLNEYYTIQCVDMFLNGIIQKTF